MECLKLHSLTFLLPIKIENQKEKKELTLFSVKSSQKEQKIETFFIRREFFFKISNNIYHFEKLRREVEKAKRLLSSQHQARVEIESFFDGEDFQRTIIAWSIQMNKGTDVITSIHSPIAEQQISTERSCFCPLAVI